VEDVIVEADGEWHTSDSRFGSVGWKANHRQEVSEASATPVVKGGSPSPAKAIGRDSNVQEKMTDDDTEVFVIDSDDEDEGRVKRELSPSFVAVSSNTSMDQLPLDSQVIDLTLDSDDEGSSQVEIRGKRKAPDNPSSRLESSWKRVRADGSPHTVMRTVNSNVNTSVSQSPPSGSNIGRRPYHVNNIQSQLTTSPTYPAQFSLPPLSQTLPTSLPQPLPYMERHNANTPQPSRPFVPRLDDST
jgi:E3 SUMO-protein ligase PIAS1